MAYPADSNYLDDAVDRIVTLLKQVGATYSVPVTRVVKAVDPQMPMPYWWVYPGNPDEATLSSDYRTQTYAVLCRLVLGTATSGYDRALAEALWVILPQTINYLVQRRHLIAESGQTTPRGLMTETVSIQQVTPFGVFTNSTDVGIELQITLPFNVTVSTEYP